MALSEALTQVIAATPYNTQLRDMATVNVNNLQILRWFLLPLRVSESKCPNLLFPLQGKS